MNRRFSILLSTLFLASCDKKLETSGATSSPATVPRITGLVPLEVAKDSGSTLFTEISPESSQVNHIYELDLNHPLKRLYSSAWACAGILTGDFNNDSLPDLFFPATSGTNKLYLNRGDWKFEEVGKSAGVGGNEGFAVGGSLADVDADGDLDIYVCNYNSPNQLFLNQGLNSEGILHFTEGAEQAQVALTDASLTSSFCDYDRDGDLDLLVLCNRLYRENGLPIGGTYTLVDGKPVIKPGLENYYGVDLIEGEPTAITIGRHDRLFRNDSTEEGVQFTDVTSEAGLTKRGYALSSTWFDYNGDSLPDLYVANDYRYPDYLWKNNGNGTFTDVAVEAVPYTPFFSMGSATGDFNNDGRDDLIALDMAATSHYKAKVAMGALTKVNRHVLDHSLPRQTMRNALFLNSGLGKMTESSFQSHLSASDWSWTPLLGDYDCDGFIDIYITNGMVRDFTNADHFKSAGYDGATNLFVGRTEWDLFEDGTPNNERNLAMKNLSTEGFKDVSKDWGLEKESVSFGSVWADFDLDGDLDIVTTNLNEPPSLYRNNASGNRFVVSLTDPFSRNRHGIGARVTIETDQGIQVRFLQPSNGFLNSNQPIVQFGLGPATQIKALAVEWPGDGNHYQILTNLPANHHLTISRDRTAPPKPPAPSNSPLFSEVPSPFANFIHKELFHDDFLAQNLLPEKQSMIGPGLALGDLDGDGNDDVFIPCGANQRDYLFFNNFGRGKPFFELDGNIPGESNCPLFFDADGDGDLDLYLARGSYEFPKDSALHSDQLYLNQGGGSFSLAPAASIPDSVTPSGQVCAADFDRDGDLDLFVAGRVLPGRYPMAPASQLLRNDTVNQRVKFTNVTTEIAPELLKKPVTVVKSALFTDANGDGWTDLLIAMDWGPLRLFLNQNGSFAEITASNGLAQVTGRWNSLTPVDFDQDGDMDYLAGNLGLNTKYHPSPEKPNILFYGDMDGSGVYHIVEAKSQKDKDRPLPVRGRS
ncbi:MAG: VCBS repeat-containing protein [Akkermansiaceae bacterium]